MAHSASSEGPRSGMQKWRQLLGLVVVFALNGCDLFGPSFPKLEGTYSAVFTSTFSNAAETVSENETGTLTFDKPEGDGTFTGSFVITGGGSGTISGVVREDGGISIDHFGDPNQDPLEALEYLQNVFWWCDFSLAASQPMSGSILESQLSLRGSISLPCYYTVGSSVESYSTSLIVEVSGTRR